MRCVFKIRSPHVQRQTSTWQTIRIFDTPRSNECRFQTYSTTTYNMFLLTWHGSNDFFCDTELLYCFFSKTCLWQTWPTYTHAHGYLNLCEIHTPNLPTENILQQMLCQEPLPTSGLWARQDLANWKYHISIHLVRIYGKKEPWAELWHGFSVKCVSPKLMARACSYTTCIIYIYIYAYTHIFILLHIVCIWIQYMFGIIWHIWMSNLNVYLYMFGWG